MISPDGQFISPLEELNAAFKKQTTILQKNYIHIRMRQRTGRTFITTVEGLPTEFNIKKMLSALQKELKCGGFIETDDDENKILSLNGDQRHGVADFLVREEIADRESIKIHGY